jgi:hypothetical protein
MGHDMPLFAVSYCARHQRFAIHLLIADERRDEDKNVREKSDDIAPSTNAFAQAN